MGLEKRDLMPALFNDDDLEMMGRVKTVFNPTGSLNPMKMFPSARPCMEVRVSAQAYAGAPPR